MMTFVVNNIADFNGSLFGIGLAFYSFCFYFLFFERLHILHLYKFQRIMNFFKIHFVENGSV